jgi:HEPN domain-containing protein
VSRRDESEHLLKRSMEFLETAEYQISKGLYGIAVFSLEQALQLFLKSKMLVAGADYPRTQGIRTLLEILSELESNEKKTSTKQVLNNYLFELGMLEDAYITSRYVMREFSREEAQRLARTVKEVMKNVT